jgi:hypothetical protein
MKAKNSGKAEKSFLSFRYFFCLFEFNPGGNVVKNKMARLNSCMKNG